MIEKLINIKSDDVRKYLSNTFWLMLEKVFRLLINVFVGIWIARSLGPANYGTLNFGIAFATVLFPLVHFGLQGVLVKELYSSMQDKETILGTSFVLKTILGLSVFLSMLIFYHFGLFPTKDQGYIVLLSSLSVVFLSFTVIESWFEAKAENRKVSVYKGIFFIISSGIKVLFIFNEMPVFYFALAYSLEFFLAAIALIISYLGEEGSLFNWRYSGSVLRKLINKSWLLILSSFSAILYLKVDQIMLGNMTSSDDLGYYSAAVKLSEAWYFVPLVLGNALFPAILSAKQESYVKYKRRIQQLSDLFFVLSFFLAFSVTFSAKFWIRVFYGEAYEPSAVILQIHIWAGVFIFLRTVLSKWLIAEDKYWFSLLSQVSGAVSNIVLNYFLIPIYGGIGAAIATIISYSITSFFILALFKETRNMFFIFLRSMFFPVRMFRL